MSRTDKTRPYWVQLTDPTQFRVVEDHDHRFGPCDLDRWDPWYEQHRNRWRGNGRKPEPQWCTRHIPYYGYSGGAWPKRRGNSWAKEERRQTEGGFRALWRSKHRRGLMLDPEGYEGDIRPRHRHQMLWDMW